MSGLQNGFIDTEDVIMEYVPASSSTFISQTTPSVSEQVLAEPQIQPLIRPFAGLGGRQLYSKEQWEAQKDVIQRLYNVENKPFKRVVEILRTGHDFFPTRRQFYRKISEWGLEKNIKENEMRAIVKSLSDGTTEKIKGHQVDPAKIQRWQKKYGRMKDVLRSCPACPISGIPSNLLLHTTGGRELSTAALGNATCISSEPTSSSRKLVIENSNGSREGEQRNLNQWDAVDVIGSPKLSRLFEKLQIECRSDISPLSLDIPISSAAQLYVSNAKMRDLHDIEERTEESVATNFPVSNSVVAYSLEVLHKGSWHSRFSKRTSSGWEFSKGFLFNNQINKLPMDRISPFPVLPATSDRSSPALNISLPFGRFRDTKAKEIEYKNQLSKLKRILGVENVWTLNTMYNLAIIYKEQGKYRPAERLFRQLAIHKERTLGFKHQDTLEAYINVIYSIFWQGHYSRAMKIHRPIHSAILKLVGPEDELALRSTLCMVETFCLMENLDEADKLTRQVLQIRLNALGPRDQRTLHAFRLVAIVLGNSGQLLESERLQRIVIQLHHESREIYELSVIDLDHLARIMMLLERYDEGMSLAEAAVEHYKGLLGPEHPNTLLGLFRVSACLKGQGRLPESESMFQTILAQQLRAIGEMHPYTLATRFELAETLTLIGRGEDAIAHYEKVFEGVIENFGLEHPRAVYACDRFGRSYEKQGRYDDALALYQRTVDQLRIAKGDEHPAVLKIRGWITDVRDIVAARQESALCEEENLDEEDESDDEGDSLDEEGCIKGGSAEEECVVTEEDWMDDLFDFPRLCEDEG